jgi:lipid A 3-O-deacylase
MHIYNKSALGRRFAALLAGLACCAAAAAAGPDSAPAARIARFATFENDSHFNTDHYYTNGIQFSLKRSDDTRPAWVRDSINRLCGWLGCEDATLLTSQTNLGQLMYTPSNITLREPQPLDRPWAGLLYAEQVYALLSADRRTLTTLGFEAGVTGRASMAEQAQKMVHRILDRPLPQGWGNQIGGTLALMASIERRTAREALSAELGGGVQLNTASYWRLAAGNLMTYAAGGLALVVGKDLPLVSPPPPGIGNKLAGEPAHDTSCLWSWLQCSAFGSIETRLMGYNLFLDGRAWQDDPHVARRVLVADAVLGLRLDFPHTRTSGHGPWFMQFKFTRRTPEFRSTFPVPHQNVGAVTVGTEF